MIVTLFSNFRYFTTVSEGLPVGSSVLKVYASDADVDKNAKITYSINRRQSDKEALFTIDSSNGLLTVNKILNYERTPVHEIVVVAKDGGDVPQETSAFITVRLTAAGGSLIRTPSPAVPTTSTFLPRLKVKYLEGDQVSEFVNVGQVFASLMGVNGFNIEQGDQVLLDSDVFDIIQDGTQINLTVKRKLDYQVELLTVMKRAEQKHMVDWIISNVRKSITAKQEDEALRKCIADLKAMAKP